MGITRRGTFIVGAALGLIPTLAKTAMLKGWAHVSGKISMRLLEPQDWSPSALEARARIAETFNRYATGHDEGRTDVVLSCFTQDVVFETGKAGGEGVSRRQERKAFETELRRNMDAMTDQRRHLIGNVLVEALDVKKGTASAIAISIVTSTELGFGLKASVIYDAKLRREKDGCWRFNYFYIGTDHFSGQGPPPADAPDKSNPGKDVGA